MKKALLIAAAVMFVASSVVAELPPVGYIGIFKDATHATDPAANTVCPAPYGNFSAWIWILPPVNGMQAAEFAVSFPPTIITLATVQNPAIAVALGTLPGISVAFAEGLCQMDWAWTHQLTLMNLAPIVAPGLKIDIIMHPGTIPPAYQLATCALGYPIEPLKYLTPLYLCYVPDGPLGVQETNWGAIKSLF
jgi:hypothetical protein